MSFWPAVKPQLRQRSRQMPQALARHNKAASGSPRIADYTNMFRASNSPGWVAIAGQFIAERQRIGDVGMSLQRSSSTSRKLGWDASDNTTLAAAVSAKIDRLDREAATLRNLRAARVT